MMRHEEDALISRIGMHAKLQGNINYITEFPHDV